MSGRTGQSPVGDLCGVYLKSRLTQTKSGEAEQCLAGSDKVQ
jgi:hypothetical protein